MGIVQYSERFLLTLWVGGMWTVGFLVTPVLFKTLDSRQLAGELAGIFFQYMGFMGLVCGSLLLLVALYIARGHALRQWRIWMLMCMIALVSIGLFYLQPMMQDLKLQGIEKGTEQAAMFGRLHGISSTLYTITCVFGLILVLFRINSPSLISRKIFHSDSF